MAKAAVNDVLAASPGDRARAAADALGDRAFTRWCGDLLAGWAEWGDPDLPDIGWLGGRPVLGWGSPERLVGETGYWARVWAARALLYVWDDACEADVMSGLGDPAWRVREMCAKVAARWEVGAAAEVCAELLGDQTTRVRMAAIRVLAVVGEGEHADPVRRALNDSEQSVRSAAERALRQLETRLDRSL